MAVSRNPKKLLCPNKNQIRKLIKLTHSNNEVASNITCTRKPIKITQSNQAQNFDPNKHQLIKLIQSKSATNWVTELFGFKSLSCVIIVLNLII